MFVFGERDTPTSELSCDCVENASETSHKLGCVRWRWCRRWCGGAVVRGRHPTPSTVEALTALDQQTPRQIMRACYIWPIIVIYVSQGNAEGFY